MSSNSTTVAFEPWRESGRGRGPRRYQVVNRLTGMERRDAAFAALKREKEWENGRGGERGGEEDEGAGGAGGARRDGGG